MANEEFLKYVEETWAKIEKQIKENPHCIDCKWYTCYTIKKPSAQAFCRITVRDFLKDGCEICDKFEWRF